MQITLIGVGAPSLEGLTGAARAAMEGAQLVLGARRLLDALPDALFSSGCRRISAVSPAEILYFLKTEPWDSACILFSGDSGFFSGTARLLPLLAKEGGYPVELLPGISSLQLFSARLKRPWQTWRLCSAHGVDCDPVYEVCHGAPCFFLTGGPDGPAVLCRALLDAGLPDLPVTIGENLGLPEERIWQTTAGAAAEETFSPLNVMLAEAAPRCPDRTPGIPDRCFARVPHIPMTKQEVRAAALSKLAIGPGDVCWDIGTGTGSVAIELALQAKEVWAVESSAEALALAEENRRTFGAWNLRLVQGTAPAALSSLSAPNAAFIGGSGGQLKGILHAVHAANEKARICVSAIALETLTAAWETLGSLGYQTEVVQIAVSRSKPAGGLHLMLSQNPVYLILGESPGEKPQQG